jgi:hypothetical protein
MNPRHLCNLLLTTAIAITAVTAAAATGTARDEPERPRRTDAGLCALFLAGAYAYPPSYSRPVLPVFGDGLPLDIKDEDYNILFSKADVADFLHDHPESSWATDLRVLPPDTFTPPHTLIFVSPIGVTRWSQREFDDWIRLQTFINWNSPKEVGDLAAHLAAGLPTPGVSPAAAQRVRNSFIAARAGELARRQENPETPLADRYDLSVFHPRLRHQIRLLYIELDKEYQAADRQMHRREVAPSLNLHFQFPDREADSEADLEWYSPEVARLPANEDTLWLGRLLLREPLLRHLYPSPAGSVGEEMLFLQAAFPELAPFWPLFQSWPLSMRQYPLHLDLGFYPVEIGPLNPEGDVVFLDLNHAIHRRHGSYYEKVYSTLQFSTHSSRFGLANRLDETQRERLHAFASGEWREFTRLMGWRYKAPGLIDEDGAVRLLSAQGGLGIHRLLAFFFYLGRKYAPEPDFTESAVSK